MCVCVRERERERDRDRDRDRDGEREREREREVLSSILKSHHAHNGARGHVGNQALEEALGRQIGVVLLQQLNACLWEKKKWK